MNEKTYLVIKNINIQDANAMSSPYTIGFPAMTAWMGAVHALQREFIKYPELQDVKFSKIAVSNNKFELQASSSSYDKLVLCNKKYPLKKNGSNSALVPDAKCHLRVSLLIQVDNLNPDYNNKLLEIIKNKIKIMRIAGGSIFNFGNNKELELISIETDNEFEVRKVLRKLMPGYVLISRLDLIKAEVDKGKDTIEALIEYMKLSFTRENTTDEFSLVTKKEGWIVPIAVGFQGLNALGKIKNQRDKNVDHRFAESIVTLGEFKMPIRFNNIDQIMWEYKVYNDLYVCENN